jgi:hypothetical protein
VIQLPQSSFWAKRKRKRPIRQTNDASRSREYLTPDEVERMIAAARRAGGRLAERDALLKGDSSFDSTHLRHSADAAVTEATPCASSRTVGSPFPCSSYRREPPFSM